MKGLKLKRHPLHIVFVHFPVACFLLSYACDLIVLNYPHGHFSLFSFYLSVVGVAIGLLALISGFLDLIALKERKEMRIGTLHGILNIIWMFVFAAFAVGKLGDYPFIVKPDTIEYIVKGIVVIGIVYSDFIGAELVYGKKGKEDRDNEKGFL